MQYVNYNVFILLYFDSLSFITMLSYIISVIKTETRQLYMNIFFFFMNVSYLILFVASILFHDITQIVQIFILNNP